MKLVVGFKQVVSWMMSWQMEIMSCQKDILMGNGGCRPWVKCVKERRVFLVFGESMDECGLDLG